MSDLRDAIARIHLEDERAQGWTNRKQLRSTDTGAAFRAIHENSTHDEAYLAGYVAGATATREYEGYEGWDGSEPDDAPRGLTGYETRLAL